MSFISLENIKNNTVLLATIFKYKLLKLVEIAEKKYLLLK